MWRTRVSAPTVASGGKWVGYDCIFKKAGHYLELVGTWWRGQARWVQRGLDGLLLVVVNGNATLVIPVYFTFRRLNPVGTGRPYHHELTCLRVMLERTGGRLQRQCWRLAAPLGVADRGFRDSMSMAQVARHEHGRWIMEASEVHGEDGYDGRLVQYLLAGVGLLHTARITCKGRGRVEVIRFGLKHGWRFLHIARVECHAALLDFRAEPSRGQAQIIMRKSQISLFRAIDGRLHHFL